MSKSFKGRVVTPGRVKAEALVSHGGFNTLASFQMALMFGDKQVKCGDQNNSDIYKKAHDRQSALFTGNHRFNNRWNGTLCSLCSI